MVVVIFVIALAGVIVVSSIRMQRPNVDPRLTMLLLLSYATRVAISPLTRNLSIFSSGAGTDWAGYLNRGAFIAQLWRYTGIHYVDADEFPELARVPLPPNVFAGVIYLNGEPTHLGCTAVVAAAATLACLYAYVLALQLGVRPVNALRTTALIAFLPSFLFYTANTFKDGFVTFFVFGVLYCAVTLARSFSIGRLALALLFTMGLWTTRYYLVFIIPAPLILGFLGLQSRSILRTALAVLMMGASVVALYAYTKAPDVVVHRATGTFNLATDQSVIAANAEGGSGVTFESTSPTATFALKLAYTLFSPFPWQSGSLGLQIGKVETIVWYYFVYRAVFAAKAMWRNRRADLLVFLSVIIPMTVAYAFTFSNIGLIVRQRIDIVLATILLASVSWERRDVASNEKLEFVAQTA